ncbi:MAG: hypothetical protein ACOX27_04730 [Caldicoprobacterales bacterium]|jgi:hypothetical protein|nr:hypothetical protein [Clostridiales bacterium]
MAKEQALSQDTTAAEKQELQPELLSIMKEEVGKARESNIPIIRAFEEIARRSGLKSNTIRNYYYRYIHANEQKVRKSTEYTGEGFQDESAIGTPFTPDETRTLMREMLIAQARGESVRGCAARLGKGNKRMLIRFQNKYRSVIAREPEYVTNLIKEIEAEGIACYNPYTRRRMSNAGRRPVSRAGADSSGQLVDWVSQLAANMQQIGISSLKDLLKGLRDLSSLAAGSKGASLHLERHNEEMQEARNRILLLENSLDEERSRAERAYQRLMEMTDINRRFIELSDEDKLSRLREYIRELKSCMQGD